MARKVLLIYPPAFWSAYKWCPSTYLVKFPLLSLFSHLRSRGVEVDVLDLELEFGRVDSANLADYSRRARELIAGRETEAAFGASSEYWHADYERMRQRLVGGWSPKLGALISAHSAAGAESHALAARLRAAAVAAGR